MRPQHTFRPISKGYTDLLQNTKKSLDAYIAENNNAWLQFIVTANMSRNDFWFIYEALSVEVKAASLNAFWDTSAVLTSSFKQSILIGQICYGISLLMAFLVYFLVLRRITKTFTDEVLLHRGTLYLIPQEILRESEPTRQYIEKLHNYSFNKK